MGVLKLPSTNERKQQKYYEAKQQKAVADAAAGQAPPEALSHEQVLALIGAVTGEVRGGGGNCGVFAIALNRALGNRGEYWAVIGDDDPDRFYHVMLDYNNVTYDEAGVADREHLRESFSWDEWNERDVDVEFLILPGGEETERSIIKNTDPETGLEEMEAVFARKKAELFGSAADTPGSTEPLQPVRIPGNLSLGAAKGLDAGQQAELTNLVIAASGYETQEDFISAYTQGHLTDLSDPAKHRWGRALPMYRDEPLTDLAAIVVGAADAPGGGYMEDIRVTYPDTYQKIHSSLRRAGGIEGATITAWRAVPEDAPDQIQVGDYVALEKSYAQMHLDAVLQGEQGVRGKLVKAEIPLKDVVWGEADFAEWAYSPRGLRKRYPSLSDVYTEGRLLKGHLNAWKLARGEGVSPDDPVLVYHATSASSAEGIVAQGFRKNAPSAGSVSGGSSGAGVCVSTTHGEGFYAGGAFRKGGVVVGLVQARYLHPDPDDEAGLPYHRVVKQPGRIEILRGGHFSENKRSMVFTDPDIKWFYRI